MERLGELNRFRKPEPVNVIKCLNCGTINKIPDDYTAFRCQKCYILIKVSTPNTSKKKFKEHNCWICFDTGLIEFKKQIDGILYTSSCRCTCKAGERWSRTIPTWDKVVGCPNANLIAKKNRDKAYKDWKELWGNDSDEQGA